MWSEYFLHAQIVAGIDIDPECMFQEGPIKTVIADSTNKNSVAAALAELAVERFDVIIDDGLHTQHAQLDTAGVLLGALDLQGVYIIEDIQQTLGQCLRLACP